MPSSSEGSDELDEIGWVEIVNSGNALKVSDVVLVIATAAAGVGETSRFPKRYLYCIIS